MSLFGGTVQQAPSYVTSSTETPKWMQDAIYNQIQWSTNIANMPYQQYEFPRVAGFSPLQEQAYRQVQENQGAWQQPYGTAMEQTQRLAGRGTAGSFAEGQQDYLRPQRVGGEFGASNQLYRRAAGQDITGVADPYLQRAGTSAVADIGSYMSPYTQNVTDQIAKMGARNLQENLLPGVSDAFIRAGQFGSKRMGEFGGRALRDTQESILQQQSQALQQGYGQALQASQADLARQAQLASTAGQLTSQEQQNLAAMAQARATAGAQQQQLGLGALQQLQAARAGDITRQMGGYQQLADLARTQQGLRAADVTALEAAGQTQQQLQQRQLDEAYRQFQEQQLYPRQQLDWLSTQIRGMAPITPTTTTQQGYSTTFGPSPLSQLMSGWSLYNAVNKG